MQKQTVPGLSATELAIVRQILSGIKEVYVFGSRAKGTHRKFSDLDLCLKDEFPLKELKISTLKEAFQESRLPYKVDLVDYHELSDDFKSLIENSCIRVV